MVKNCDSIIETPGLQFAASIAASRVMQMVPRFFWSVEKIIRSMRDGAWCSLLSVWKVLAKQLCENILNCKILCWVIDLSVQHTCRSLWKVIANAFVVFMLKCRRKYRKRNGLTIMLWRFRNTFYTVLFISLG